MTIERERKFILNIDQVRQLTDGINPSNLTQHYFSQTEAPSELRTRRTESPLGDPKHTATRKQGYGECREETEIYLQQQAFDATSHLAVASLHKRRFNIDDTNSITVDTFMSSRSRLYSVLEVEQQPQASDIGLFDPNSLKIGQISEVTGLPDFSSRALATETSDKPVETTPIEHVLEELRSRLSKASSPLIATLSGPSASGKTTILEAIEKDFGNNCTLLSTDDYYIGKTAMATTMPNGHQANFDHPAAIDIKRLAKDIAALKEGHAIEQPVYDMLVSEPKLETANKTPSTLIIIEGIAANLPEIRQLSDLPIALTAPLSERLERRIARDSTRKGYSAEQTLDVFMNHVEPSYQEYYAPHDKLAEYTIG